MKEKSENSSRLGISKNVEIVIGQTVPVLQHTNCAGLTGKVEGVDIPEKGYVIRCDRCEKSVILDIKTLVERFKRP
jgi:hypothetical protein